MHYSLFSKCSFYITYAFYKIIAPLECHNFRLKILFNELTFLLYTLGLRSLRATYSSHILLKTIFGDFYIRDMNNDLNIASPSFERLDLNELLNRIRMAINRNHKVLFIDVGAGFGKYTITIGHMFRKYQKRLAIYSYEPEPESYELLNKNVLLNQLKNVRTYRRALSDKKRTRPFFYFEPMKMYASSPPGKKIIIHTDILDSYTKYFSKGKNTEVFIKIDVEGHEIEVLKGLKKISNCILLIEDSAGATSQKLFNYLSNHGKLLVKKTPYNSFWLFSIR